MAIDYIPTGPGHQWRDNRQFGYSVCVRCGLDDYQAQGIACSGQATHVCPTHANAHSHGECLAVFPTRQAASAHWQAVHGGCFVQNTD